MNIKFKLFLKTFITCLLSFAIFVGSGYIYLSKKFKQANNDVNNVPYSQTLSENKGILFNCSNEKFFLYLDFLENKLVVSLTPEISSNSNIYGYSHDYTINGDSTVINNIIDCVGGVELIYEDTKLRYTGLQVNQLLKRSHSKELRRDIISKVSEKIVTYGIGNEFFSGILNNSITELKFSECCLWRDYLPQLCENIIFIDYFIKYYIYFYY